MERPNGLRIILDEWLREGNFSDGVAFLNVRLACGHTLASMTSEGVRRLVAGGEAVERVTAYPFGPKWGEGEMRAAGVLMLGCQEG